MAKIPLQAFQEKCLILFGRFVLHTPHQTLCIFIGSEQLALWSSAIISWASLYALLTINLPFLSSAHTSLSFVTKLLRGVLRIASASWGKNRPFTSSMSHFLPPFFIKSLTILTQVPRFSGVTTLYVLRAMSHWSCQTHILQPSPTYYFKPRLTRGWATIMLRQAKEALLPILASTNSPLGKCLAL